MALPRWPFFNEAPFFPEELLRSFAPFTGASPRPAGVYPPVNLYDDGQSFLLRAEIPGARKESLDVSLKGDELTLRGERVIGAAEPNASYHRRERDAGQFRRVVTLPDTVDADKISARYQDGVLEVTLPRSPKAQPRKVEIH